MFLPLVKPIFRMIFRILSFILFILTLISAYGGRMNPEYLMLPSVLTLALPYFAIATIIVTIAWLCAGRWFTAAIGVLVLVAAWQPISTAMPLHMSKKAEYPDRTFKLLTYNILHSWDQEDPEMKSGNRALRYVLDSGADLVGLQELVNYDNPEEVLKFNGPLRDSLFTIYPYRAGTDASDLKVLSKYPVKLISDNYTHALYEVTLPWGKLHWINVHLISFQLTDEERMVMSEVLSVKDTEQGLKEMKGSIREKLKTGFTKRAECAREVRELIESTPGPLIISGDFNDVPESYTYRILKGDDLADAYTETSFGPMITYNRHAFWFHIDQILYRPNPLLALSVKKGHIKSSDHYPLIVEFEWLKQ